MTLSCRRGVVACNACAGFDAGTGTSIEAIARGRCCPHFMKMQVARRGPRAVARSASGANRAGHVGLRNANQHR